MTNTIEIKVRGYHLDVYGHVNNARYLEFLEEGRWSMFEEKADLEAWRRRGLAFFVVNINISYRKAASLGDILQIKTSVARLGNSSGVVRQEVYLKETGALVADADITFVIVDGRVGKALPLTGDLAEELKALMD